MSECAGKNIIYQQHTYVTKLTDKTSWTYRRGLQVELAKSLDSQSIQHYTFLYWTPGGKSIFWFCIMRCARVREIRN